MRRVGSELESKIENRISLPLNVEWNISLTWECARSSNHIADKVGDRLNGRDGMPFNLGGVGSEEPVNISTETISIRMRHPDIQTLLLHMPE